MVFEILVGGRECANLAFLPFSKVVRGQYEIGYVQGKDPNAASVVLQKYGPVIPGQVIGYDTELKTGYVREPLWEDKEMLQRIEKGKFRLDPPIEKFPAEQDTCLYWMHRAVMAGDAKEEKGVLKGSYDETKVRKTFFYRPLESGQSAASIAESKELREIVTKQQDQIQELLTLLKAGIRGGRKGQTEPE